MLELPQLRWLDAMYCNWEKISKGVIAKLRTFNKKVDFITGVVEDKQ